MGRNRQEPGQLSRSDLVSEWNEAWNTVMGNGGSYDRNLAADLSRVGWIILCLVTGSRLTGSFWERSEGASLYRAELLGLCALHTLAKALEEYYQIKKWTSVMCCNNEKALEMSSYHL